MPARLRSSLSGTVLLLLSGCLSDPPPDPAVAPLEIVATSTSCTLNRESVAAGTHEVTVIMQEGSGRVRIVKGGSAVFDKLVATQSEGSAPPTVQLGEGSYAVECVVDGSTSTTSLTVTA